MKAIIRHLGAPGETGGRDAADGEARPSPGPAPPPPRAIPPPLTTVGEGRGKRNALAPSPMSRSIQWSRGVEDLLRIALVEIQHYGASSTQVPERLTRLLDDLDDLARPEHRAALRRVRAELGRTAAPG